MLRIYVTIAKLFSWIKNVYLKLPTGLTGALLSLIPAGILVSISATARHRDQRSRYFSQQLEAESFKNGRVRGASDNQIRCARPSGNKDMTDSPETATVGERCYHTLYLI